MYRDKWRILLVPVHQTELISKDKESIDNTTETTKFTRVKITYEGPIVSYVIYEGRNPAVVS
jgi:hypothetical protein